MRPSSTQFPQTAKILRTHALRTQPSDLSTSPICPPPTISDTRHVILHHNGNHCPLTTCRLAIESHPRDMPAPSNHHIIRLFQCHPRTLPLAHDSPGIRVTQCTCIRRHKLGHGSEIIYNNQQWTCEELPKSNVDQARHSELDSPYIRFLVTNASRDEAMIWLVRTTDYTVTWRAIRQFRFKAIHRYIFLWLNEPED